MSERRVGRPKVLTTVRVLWIVRFFRWYIAAGANGSGYTRVIWGRVAR